MAQAAKSRRLTPNERKALDICVEIALPALRQMYFLLEDQYAKDRHYSFIRVVERAKEKL